MTSFELWSERLPLPVGAIEKGRTVEPGFIEVSYRCEQQSNEELLRIYRQWVVTDGWTEHRPERQGAAGWSIFVKKAGIELTLHGYVSPKPHDPPPMLYVCAENAAAA